MHTLRPGPSNNLCKENAHPSLMTIKGESNIFTFCFFIVIYR